MSLLGLPGRGHSQGYWPPTSLVSADSQAPVVKRTGDGSLTEFRSVVDAVRCAIEAQNGMVGRNAGLPPERCIEVRVGIYLGDGEYATSCQNSQKLIDQARADWRCRCISGTIRRPSQYGGVPKAPRRCCTKARSLADGCRPSGWATKMHSSSA